MQGWKTFYLASSEGPRNGHPWQCEAIRRIVWVSPKIIRHDGLLISVSPPIPSGVYDNQSPITGLVLFSRSKGDSLFPVSPWPLYVNICVINNDRIKDTGRAEENDLTFYDIGYIGDIEQINKSKYTDSRESGYLR